MGKLAAAIFDLDGVVTLTARVHFLAWKRLLDEVAPSHPFDRDAYLKWVDGKPRFEGLRAYLDAIGRALPEGSSLDALASLKNDYFLEIVEKEGVEVDQDTVVLIRALRAAGVRIGLATSSRNAGMILKRSGLESLFEARVDGVESARLGLRGKPQPDIFLECLKRLGRIDPGDAVLFEDATAGVAAARAGKFGLVVGVDRGQSWIPLREHGADWIIRSFTELTVDRISAWMRSKRHHRPHVIAQWSEVEHRLRAQELAIFLDYDGTLTPIVDRPDLAVLSEDMRDAVRRLAEQWPVAIVSGRDLPDLKERIHLDSVWYVASHGFDIERPDRSTHRVLPALEQTIDDAAERLRPRVARVPGALLEEKRFAIAVHYRMADDARVRELERAVDEVVALFPWLTVSFGKKVFEIRPAIPWNKGRAVLWLLEEMRVPDALPIFIGDDTTDEDAFAAVHRRGLGILVAAIPRPTEARWSLQDPEEVRDLLDRLTALGGSP